MKLTIFYFDQKVSKIFNEKIDDNGNKSIVLSSQNNFVYNDEIVAKIVNVDSPDDVIEYIDKGYQYYKIEKYTPFKAGEGIFYDEFSSVYRAMGYGFVVFNRNTSKITLLSPLKIRKDKLKASFYIYPTKFKKIPEYKDIEEILSQKHIITILEKSLIEKQLNDIDLNTPRVNRITVAAGKEPVNAYNEHYIPLIELTKKAGKVLEDGRIDFKEIDSIFEVKKRQKILKKIPEREAEDGYDVFGEKVPGSVENKGGYLKGKNIIQTLDKSIYASAVDGCIEIERRTISVSPIAFINGDIDYDSGNIDFQGSVHISGSVLPGFSVKAKDNIIIGKNVDDAYIEAGGDILVKLGIGGKSKTKVISGGTIKAKYILNSMIEAVGEIQIADSIINSNVFSNDKITVTDKHGKIIGGEIIALHEITVNVSGVPQGNKTILAVGRSLLLEREIKDIKKQRDSMKLQVDETSEYIKSIFGEKLFGDPKKYLSNLTPVRQKSCLLLLSKLSNCNEKLHKLIEQYNEVEARYKPAREPSIIITNEAYAGTVINIKKRRRTLNDKLLNVKFYEDPEEKVIRFTSSV